MSTASSAFIGEPDGEHVRIAVLQRKYAASGEYYDDNWLEARITIRVAGFHAEYPADLLTEDLARLREALARLTGPRSPGHRAGREEWEPLEPWLLLRFDMGVDDGRVSGVARERFDDGNSLRFSMQVAWRAIDAAIDGLDLLLIEFPVLGSVDTGEDGDGWRS